MARGDGGGWQPLGEPGPELAGVGGGAVGGDEVRGELVAGRGGVGGDGGGGDGGVRAQRGLDFLGFDALAEDLDLQVVAAVEFQLAGAGEAGEVAGAVHAAAWRPIRVGDEHGGGLGGAAQVAVADPGPGDAQLAGGARRDGPLPVVQDADDRVAVGAADQRHRALGDVRAASRPQTSRQVRRCSAEMVAG